MTVLYAILHLLVDGICAYAMFGYFLRQEQGYVYVLLYNFCAFALQMPFGAALDLLNRKRGKSLPFATACAGLALTLTGVLTHPVVLGIGNALFHIGGGVGTIYEDETNDWRGRGLGIFVAPGALGLYLGTQLAGINVGAVWWCIAGGVMFIAVAGVGWGYLIYIRPAQGRAGYDVLGGKEQGRAGGASRENGGAVFLLGACVFLVVILRSYIGMAVTFPWKTTAFAVAASTLAVVCGKAAGGFLAARIGILRTVVLSLTAAAVFYLFSGSILAGILALFLFNMTMPVTLYLLIRRLPLFPGFSFGFLTFGLFLGFLPAYLQLSTWQNSSMIGCIGSVLSLLILACGVQRPKFRR